MTVEEIKKAVDAGKKVYWSNTLYEVIKDSIGQYLIHVIGTSNYIGLTWKDGKTLNGDECQFFVLEG